MVDPECPVPLNASQSCEFRLVWGVFAPAAPISLQQSQLRQLNRLLRAGSTTQRVARRCRIILLAHQGISNSAIAAQLEVSRPTVNATRSAFRRGGIRAIQRDKKRKRSGRLLSKEMEQRILDTTLQTAPPDGTQWSVRLMAQQLGVSRMSVQRVWKRFAVQPHRVECFKLSNDPHFDEKVRDVVGLYLDPPDQALVLCVDEKNQIQALDRTRPILPLGPGPLERQPDGDKRYGTTTLFAAFNIITGKVIGSCLPRHRGKEFVKFLNQLDQDIPSDLDIHIIGDNRSMLNSVLVQAWLKPRNRRRFHVHVTPTSSSWLHQVERWFGLITERMIGRGTLCSAPELEQAIYQWLATWNDKSKPFVWNADADAILDNVRHNRGVVAKS
jgi:transposase